MEEKLHYKMTIKLWKDDKVFGPGICQLLTMIEETGSMHQAAARMGLAYSKAWKMMKTAEEGLGFALTERVSGGRSGGGSRITEEGRKMLEQYLAFEAEAREQVTPKTKDFLNRFLQMEQEMNSQAARLFEKYFGDRNA